MSQENVELVRDIIAAVPDWEEVSALLHPDARFDQTRIPDKDGLLRSNPVHGVRIPTGADGQEEHANALTRADLALLLAALPADWRLFFEFLTHTGLRISEAIGLTWHHVDLGVRPRVLVREQVYEGQRQALKFRHARRDISLSPGMVGQLRALRHAAYGGEDAPVFATATGTELSRANVASRVLKPAADDLGVGWVSFHSFGHTSASPLFDAGKNVRQVAEWLGHADPAFTLRTYVHLLDEGLGDADFLDAVVGDQELVQAGKAATHTE